MTDKKEKLFTPEESQEITFALLSIVNKYSNKKRDATLVIGAMFAAMTALQVLAALGFQVGDKK